MIDGVGNNSKTNQTQLNNSVKNDPEEKLKQLKKDANSVFEMQDKGDSALNEAVRSGQVENLAKALKELANKLTGGCHDAIQTANRLTAIVKNVVEKLAAPKDAEQPAVKE